MSLLVLTVIGDDRPGLVQAMADTVATGGGNWERSQLAHLAGQFAGLVEVSVHDDRAPALIEALSRLEGLEVSVRPGHAAQVRGGASLVLELVGNDRPRIVSDVTSALAAHGVNIERLDTSTEEAAMAGGTLFRARAELSLPEGRTPEALRAALERLADELMVDLTVDAEPLS